MRNVLVDAYSSDELCARAAISYRQLDHACRNGVLQPLGHSTPGSGFVRRFDQREVRVAVAVGRLLDLRMPCDALRRVARTLRDLDDDAWTGTVAVSRSGVVAPGAHDTTFGEACWLLNLGLCATRAAS